MIEPGRARPTMMLDRSGMFELGIGAAKSRQGRMPMSQDTVPRTKVDLGASLDPLASGLLGLGQWNSSGNRALPKGIADDLRSAD